MKEVVSVEKIESKIFHIRGKRVMLDHDLARLYGVPTKVLNQAVKRNLRRFPVDFMLMLTKKEKAEVVTNCDHLKGLRFSSSIHSAPLENFSGKRGRKIFRGERGLFDIRSNPLVKSRSGFYQFLRFRPEHSAPFILDEVLFTNNAF
ncbi:MAG: ORF6N domain-containing protein [Candidatus Omnitrophica bacterium]|nr:ORF6N domain-containing protein [Candidatus Omnitrophota bacterium]